MSGNHTDVHSFPTRRSSDLVRWRHRLTEEGGEASERRAAMRAANPAFIPRNHLVEEAISAAVNVGDFQPFESLLDRKSTRLNSSHPSISYAVFCLKKKIA